MDDTHRHFTLYGKAPLIQMFFSLLIILVSGILLFLISLLAGSLFFDKDFATLYGYVTTGSGDKGLDFLRYMVVSQDLSLFIVPGIFILTLMKPFHSNMQVNLSNPVAIDVILVIVLTLCVIPVTSFTGELNSAMNLPDWMSGVEQWMETKEDEAARLIGLIIQSETFWIMILNLLIIAVIPAIGEELIFRGVFQKIFYGLFRSGHLAVWITAFIFSAIHFQFFGFIPRLILGLVFGYLYLWSGTLWLPVIAHFVNNAIPVIGAYLNGWDKMIEPVDFHLWKQIIRLPVPIIISAAILIYFCRKSKKNSSATTG